MGSENIIEFTDANFEQEALKSEVPVLVDLWAEWCMPCHMQAPIVEELADEYAGKVKVGKLDTDANRQTAGQLGITAIPTLLVLKDGQVAKMLVGLQNKKNLKAILDGMLA